LYWAVHFFLSTKIRTLFQSTKFILNFFYKLINL
jgi:hypothetical protein